jgi:cation transport protein ChaC
MTDFWVFGYGSLTWRPGFDHAEKRPALMRGAHRSLCIYSVHHRGTRDKPGLVLGLDRGGSCWGTAYRVKAALRDEVIAYLRSREQVTLVYKEVWRRVLLDGRGDRPVKAICYMVDRAHRQYAGRLPIREQARLVRQGVGAGGPNPDYIENTVLHFEEIGIDDVRLRQLYAELKRI